MLNVDAHSNISYLDTANSQATISVLTFVMRWVHFSCLASLQFGGSSLYSLENNQCKSASLPKCHQKWDSRPLLQHLHLCFFSPQPTPMGLPQNPLPCRDSLPTPRPPERFVCNQKRQGFAMAFCIWQKCSVKEILPRFLSMLSFWLKKFSSLRIANHHYDTIDH